MRAGMHFGKVRSWWGVVALVGLTGLCLVSLGCGSGSDRTAAPQPSTSPPSGAAAGDPGTTASSSSEPAATANSSPAPSASSAPSNPDTASTPTGESPAASQPHDTAAATGGAGAQYPPLFDGWPVPQFVLALSGRQHGYVEPCGCTGLANQKGGLARRHTFLQQLAEKGWPTVPLDVGNQVRRFGRQAEIKFQITVEGLKKMGYAASTFGPDDLRLTIDELAATTAQAGDLDTAFISANVAILDREFTPRFRVVEIAGKRLGVIGVLGDQARQAIRADEILTEPAVDGLRTAWQQLSAAGCDHAVLLVQGTRDETLALAQAVPQFDIVVTSGGGDEPTLVPENIAGTKALLVQVGAKGMYMGVLGFFDDPQTPWRYQRVPLDARYADSRDMLDLLATYQSQLEQLGLEGLGVRPLPHPSGRQFVGSEACGDCHTKAYAVWKESPHSHATDSLVHPAERSEIARHFDPECLSCHVTGWNPQRFTPYDSGYLSLTGTPKTLANGCENCHGPGSAHVAAESGEAGNDEALIARLRQEMRLLLGDAEKKCLECHDLDNSPDFHTPGAFEKYWQQVVHPGKD